MNTTVLTLGMVLLFVLVFLLAIRAIYRLVIFRLTTEQREIVLKSADLLDRSDLSDTEVRVIAVAVRYLYDYRAKRMIASDVLDYMRSHTKAPHRERVRSDVESVSKAFASLVLADNPIHTLRMLKIMSDRRSQTSSNGSNGQSALVRAEITVASKLPTMDVESCQPVLA